MSGEFGEIVGSNELGVYGEYGEVSKGDEFDERDEFHVYGEVDVWYEYSDMSNDVVDIDGQICDGNYSF